VRRGGELTVWAWLIQLMGGVNEHKSRNKVFNVSQHRIGKYTIFSFQMHIE